MKKILAIILASAMLLSMAACSKADEREEADKRTRKMDETVAEIKRKSDETKEPGPETEPPKRGESFEIEMSDRSTNDPVKLMGEDAVGIHVKFNEGYMSKVDVSCPSWSNDIGNITFKMYKWDTDYKTTVASQAIEQKTFINYRDNDTLEMSLSKSGSNGIGLEPGEYLFWIGGGVDESGSGVGMWSSYRDMSNPYIKEIYFDGYEVTDSCAPNGTFYITVPGEK